VLVGEIRDWETLDTAMEAAMTGHLVFSTLHTNSSAETITRVYNLGAKPYQICGTFNLIMAQRLSRKICAHCQQSSDLNQSNYYTYAKESISSMDAKKLENELKLRNITQEQRDNFGKGMFVIGTGQVDGKTCPYCNGTGYK
jgi:type II secretory ATPase GspE/PulE/Tfp pilus assembly ATPase PilB-like protein